ncbi:MAG: Alpha-amylase [Promethearchaeota archaeon]|nr:MAG: Alpha-amylase [Candidatus Lokiarchaeota archaeon]
MTTYWAPLLHLYQPPWQDVDVLRKINHECYKPLFEVIELHENAKFSININGVLIELLDEYGMSDTIELLRNLESENKVEILGTAKYHPILPLIPEKEVLRQIQMNEDLNKEFFGDHWERKGFFPPELAVSPNVAKIVREQGYEWIIMSGIACPAKWCYDQIYHSPKGLKLFFRDDILSNKISFKKATAKEFLSEIGSMHKSSTQEGKNNTYVITAMDGETFGWHIKNYETTFIGKALNLIEEGFINDTPTKNVPYPKKPQNNDITLEKDTIKIEFISNLDQFFPISREPMTPLSSSWSTSYDDLQCKVCYPLWHHPENNIHVFYSKTMRSLNKLMNLADNLDLTREWKVENHYNTARWFYDRALHSCPMWWANPFQGTWSPNLIYKGLELIIKAALNAQLALVYAGINDGDGYFDSISYYHGLILMEIYNVSRKNNKKG